MSPCDEQETISPERRRGYHTIPRFLLIEAVSGERHAKVRVDFTGDFGHEIGVLGISIDENSLIVRIDADLE